MMEGDGMGGGGWGMEWNGSENATYGWVNG